MPILPRLLPLALAALLPARLPAGPPPSAAGYGSMSCSTFLQDKGGVRLVGHNLDERIEMPGMILVNPRGVAKSSFSYQQDMMAFFGPRKDTPRTSWISRYGSLVYSACGREFIDGGMNEAGLYIGEMTLLGTQYPDAPGLVKIHHHAWMQYLLDNYATVPEALESLRRVVPEGHCQWHFFLADREGRAALVSFAKKQTVIRTGETLPLKVATNLPYPATVAELATFQGFGGTRAIDWTYNPKDDLRHVWAAEMLRRFGQAEGPATPGQAFEILNQLGCGTNRWALVFDLAAGRVHWTTYKSRNLRHVDLGAFDLTAGRPVLALDIHRPVPGDARAAFQPLTPEAEAAGVKRFWAGVDTGFLGNLAWKPRVVSTMTRYQRHPAPK